MLYKQEENRPYRRYKHTAKEQKVIRQNGFEPVVSSNVSAIAREENVLYVRFHDSSVYAYPKSGKLYDKMLHSKSKGKFVWNELIRKKVPYRKASMKVFSVNKELEQQAPINLMQQAQDAKSELGYNLLVGLALSTMIDTKKATVETLVSNTLAQAINSNAL